MKFKDKYKHWKLIRVSGNMGIYHKIGSSRTMMIIQKDYFGEGRNLYKLYSGCQGWHASTCKSRIFRPLAPLKVYNCSEGWGVASEKPVLID